MEDVQLTFTLLTRLREMGVRVAIDDFGTGHSSLNYLKRFPIDTLKIDRSFVEDLPDRFEDAAIVRAVLELARGLDLRVVAEGVETKAQLDFLQGHECREVQGFYFAEPMPANELREFMQKGEAAVAR
jgi:EAL domain-containing protein (putative c-di-GMP-specific phosphodiesterase class I)